MRSRHYSSAVCVRWFAVAYLSAFTFLVQSSHSQDEISSTSSTKSTSFESQNVGRFDKITTDLGVWNSLAGNAIIDGQHAKAGNQCLQLAGGENCVAELKLNLPLRKEHKLEFWAERWTSRNPFRFRIDVQSEDEWSEIYNGDTKVRVGRSFLNHVQVAVPAGTTTLRLSVSSPPRTGILIDDVRLSPATPQRIVAVEGVPMTLPALRGQENNPMLKLRVLTEGSLDPISLQRVIGKLQFADKDLRSVKLLCSGPDNSLANATAMNGSGLSNDARRENQFVFEGNHRLHPGENILWLTGKIAQDADLENTVGVTCTQVTFSNGVSKQITFSQTQRLGEAVRSAGEDDVHTFRIPGLATTNAGTLIGVYDVRYRSSRDLPGDIDVGMSRSTDGGQTWESMKIIMDMGEDPDWQYDGIGDPAILVDRRTGTIWVAATWSHGNRSWNGSGPGLSPTETGQLMLVRSDDDGKTWSNPINITKQIKKPEWSFILQGPGKGITMQDGTLVFPAQFQDPPSAENRQAHRLPHSTIIYSKDHGESWQVGSAAFDDTTESQVVEVEPGKLMLNCRYNRKSARVVMTTTDLGKTWQKHLSSELALIEPRACMASLIHVANETGTGQGDTLLFSNPDSTQSRKRIAIKASKDGGKTWPKQHRLLLDEGACSGYSCMSMIDDKTIGILYEGSRAQMTFQRISLDDVLSDPQQNEPSARKVSSLSLPPVFADHMVFQADAELPIFGTAKPKERVSVRLDDRTLETTADENGRWEVRFTARRASSDPITLSVSTKGRQVSYSDILVGEVWFCAGQSNMEWPLSQTTDGPSDFSKQHYPNFRLLRLTSNALGKPGSYGLEQIERLKADRYLRGSWQTVSPESTPAFSAVAWHFGRKLQDNLDLPVGLICNAIGGTPTEAWIPYGQLQADPELKGLVEVDWLNNGRLGDFCRTRAADNLRAAIQAGEAVPSDELGPNHAFKPGFMWDAGVATLVPYAIRGVIWYQGESNAETPARIRDHLRLFPTMVDHWRESWNQENLPFLYVQLPALNRPHWPLFRETQRRLLASRPDLYMAVTLDTGHPTDVHPRAKKPIGERLGGLALTNVYHPTLRQPSTGPALLKTTTRGREVVLKFANVGAGIQPFSNEKLRHFEICGDDGVFHPASADIAGNDTLVLSSENVQDPVYARYAWIPFPEPQVNFFDDRGLPASPFTTAANLDYSESDENGR